MRVKIMIASDLEFSNQEKYWVDKLSGELSLAQFISDNGTNNDMDTKKKHIEFELRKDLYYKINKYDDQSLYVFLLAGLACLIFKYTGNEDIIIGAPTYKLRNNK